MQLSIVVPTNCSSEVISQTEDMVARDSEGIMEPVLPGSNGLTVN